MKHISVNAFKEVVESESNNSSVDFINVCTPAEYKEKHISGVRSVPLDTIESQIETFNQKKTLYIHCRSGGRGQKAVQKLQDLGVTAELINVEGGLLAWEEAGHETGSHTTRISIMRQTFIAAGALVAGGIVLGHIIDPAYQLISFFVALGLLVSGITGWCGMALLLGKMPWNK